MLPIARPVAGLFLATLACAGVLPSAPTSGAPQVPFAFVQNQAQADPSVLYIGTGPEFKAWFRKDGVVLQQRETAVRMKFAGRTVATNPPISAADPLGATANYLRGNDPAQWKTSLPLYGAIEYRGVWPGIDLTYKASNSRVKAEYLVAPGAQVNEIALRFDGVASLEPDGTLRIHGEHGDFVEDKPVMFQTIDGQRRVVEGGFHQHPDGTIGFTTAAYDERQPLVIDPAILFSGFFGGSSQESITAIGFDVYNNVIVAGWSSSTDLPATAGVKPRNAGGVDAFVASFSPNGGGMTWCTYLGGTGDDRAFGLAIDAARNIYVTGWTSSINFPLANAYQSHLSGSRDAFVSKLTPAGNALVYSTYLGGSAVDAGNAIALDATNAAVIVGDTTSANLPVTSRAFQARANGAQDGFVAKLSPLGNSLAFFTYLGGSGIDHPTTVKVDGAGSVFTAGSTWSTNFPTAAAFQPRSGGGQDGFLSKLSADGATMLFSTYLGGSTGAVGTPEQVNGIFVDLLGNVVAAGVTSSANFPVTVGALQTTFGGQSDGFISRFSNRGALLNSTFLGGGMIDGITAIALDYHGDAYVTGDTVSQDFPIMRGLQVVNNGTMNAFVVKLDPTLSTIVFGTYIGGSSYDCGNAIAVDAQTSILVAGQTSSSDFPTAGNLQSTLPSQLSSFITKLAPAFTIGIDYLSVMVTDPWHVSWFTAVSTFGNPTDLPITGDWDGTGKKRLGSFSNGIWYLDITGDGYFGADDKTVSFGQAGDIPVVGDWLGTGHFTLGLFRNGTFILDLSGHLTGVPTGRPDAVYTAFGRAGDLPVAADWNGSGATKVGVFRAGAWLVDYNGDGVFNASDKTYTYGQAGDLPVIGDWDSSGHASKLGVYRNGLWILDYDGDNAWTVPVLNEMVLAFGTTGYLPLIF